MNPKLSVCIPAYNRPGVLKPLLDSVLSQDFTSYEIVICEDKSPKRKEIAEVVQSYYPKYQQVIKYYENQENLGYDGNLRNLIEKATGEYCFFMGNDDLMCPDALSTVALALKRYDNVGVVLRSYAAFDDIPENINQVYKYFESERFFPAGAETISTFFRRSVTISGMVIHREKALKYATSEFDGTLLYQIYLIANILTEMNGTFLPEILVLYRRGGIPDFGNSQKEKNKFVPCQQTPESSLHFIQGMLNIAKYVEDTRQVAIYDRILNDLGNYSYPLLSVQAQRPLCVYINYSYNLAKMGFWKNMMFYLYFFLILLIGSRQADRLIKFVKKRIGHTPIMGNIYQGKSS